MDFDDEVRIYLKRLYYLDVETHQKLTEMIKSARTTTNKHQAGRLLDSADSLAYKVYIAQIEIVDEFKLETSDDIKVYRFQPSKI